MAGFVLGVLCRCWNFGNARSSKEIMRSAVLFLGMLLTWACLGACAKEVPLEPRSLTFGELRVVKSGVTVEAPGEGERVPYPRHRLLDGTRGSVKQGGLVWLRRDDGALFLLRGPASFRFRAEELELDSGQLFASVPPGIVVELVTPQRSLRLAGARVSVQASAERSEIYVLRGEVNDAGKTRAGPGERLVLLGKDVKSEPQLVWQDWTGGLATTDQSPAPPPFGVGTVGARPPGDSGAPRRPLTVQRLALDVKFDGQFAVSEVDQTFFNAESTTVEGIYHFRTPPGATLLRFGVDRGGRLVWGRVKERAAAALQYASNVYEGSTEDPALLEWVGPGEYKARLYPIEPGAVRRVVVRYSEWLPRMGEDGERRLYTYPMAAEGAEESLPRIEELTATFDLMRAGAREVRSGMGGVRDQQELVIRAHDFVPRADLAVELFDSGRAKLRAWKADHVPDLEALAPDAREAARQEAREEPDYLLLPLGALDVAKPSTGIDLSIVVDTSRATEPSSLALASAATAALLEHMGSEDRVALFVGSDGTRPLLPGESLLVTATPEYRKRALAALATIEPGGATDLGLMLSQAQAVLGAERAGAVVYIGDGAPTVGELSLRALSEKLGRLPRPFRVFALGTGDGANLVVLDGMANGGFAERLSDRHSAAAAALRVLERAALPTTLGLQVDFGPDVERVYPRSGAALTVDEGLLVVGRLVGANPKSVKVTGPGFTRELPLAVSRLEDHGDLRQRWAQARLGQLLDDGESRAALVDLGMRYGIITPATSLYVPTKNEIEEERAVTRAESDHDDIAAAAEELKEAEKREGGEGTRAKAEEGSMGAPAARGENQRYAVEGPRDNAEPHLSRQAALKDAAEFGLIGAVPPGGVPQEAPAPRKAAAPPPPAADKPSPTGVDPESFNLGGAGLGEGGGGKGDGIGLGSIGTLGGGAGTGTGQGFGAGHGRLGGSHATDAPKVRMGAVTVTGRLPKEVIQRIVRQNFGRFRLCYEQAAARNTERLEGRIVMRFTIDPSGSVSDVDDDGSSVSDSGMLSCVESAFYGLSFPAPEGGPVKVVYPISFEGARTGGATPSASAAAAVALRPSGTVAAFGHNIGRCGLASALPLAERAILWRERLAGVTGSAGGVARVYRETLTACEASDWRSRARLFSLLLDALPKVPDRVELWRILFYDLGARDALYRGILARVKSASELRELHAALGLQSIDAHALSELLGKAKTSDERIALLQDLRAKWPDDLALQLTLLDALEDGERLDAARELARELRARPDASTEVRTSVGELYLRLAARAGKGAESRAAEDLGEAKRSFGEIVEFAPDDPVARRRLGDLLRAHGFFDEARRQYETLAQLLPDDPTVGFLVAAAAEGQGRLEEALSFVEKARESGDPDSSNGPAAVGRSLALCYLAWGRDAARREKSEEDVEILSGRAERLLARGLGERPSSKGSVRVTLTWTHPDFHPTLWTNALGSAMPAPDGDVALGVSEAVFPVGADSFVEVRLDELSLARAARFGAAATLTAVFDELTPEEHIVRLEVRFEKDGPATLQYRIRGKELHRG